MIFYTIQNWHESIQGITLLIDLTEDEETSQTEFISSTPQDDNQPFTRDDYLHDLDKVSHKIKR